MKENHKGLSTSRKVAIGATSVIAAAGVIAGAALLSDKDRRKNLASGMKKSAGKLKETVTDAYQPMYHQLNTKKSGTKKTTSKKRARK